MTLNFGKRILKRHRHFYGFKLLQMIVPNRWFLNNNNHYRPLHAWICVFLCAKRIFALFCNFYASKMIKVFKNPSNTSQMPVSPLQKLGRRRTTTTKINIFHAKKNKNFIYSARQWFLFFLYLSVQTLLTSSFVCLIYKNR